MSRGIDGDGLPGPGKLASMTMGQRIRAARERLGLGVNELDRAIGTRSGYVSRLEADEFGSVGSDKLARISSVLKVSLDWIVLGRGRLEEALVEESGRRVRERPGWAEALKEGHRRFPSIDDACWEAVGAMAGPDLPARVDVAFIVALARAMQDASASGLTEE